MVCAVMYLTYRLFNTTALRSDWSLTTRTMTYKAALSIVPKFALLGTGLGNSDSFVQAAVTSPEAKNATVHSVPLKILLELGIIGFVASIAFAVASIRAPLREVRQWDNANAALDRAYLSAVAVAFCTMVFQPFIALMIYPFVIALGHGRSPGEPTRKISKRSARVGLCAALVVVALVIASNTFMFQRAAAQWAEIGGQLAYAIEAESKGNYSSATERYLEAKHLALERDPPPRKYTHLTPELRKLIDFERLEESIRIDNNQPIAHTVAAFGAARCYLSAGKFEASGPAFAAILGTEPGWAAAWFLYAESCWRAGAFAEAIHAYGRAAKANTAPLSQAYANALIPSDPSPMVVSGDIAADTWIAAAERYRLRGEWDRAVACAKYTIAISPANAHAHFLLGVDAETRGDVEAAIAAYQFAIRNNANHLQARDRFKMLEE